MKQDNNGLNGTGARKGYLPFVFGTGTSMGCRNSTENMRKVYFIFHFLNKIHREFFSPEISSFKHYLVFSSQIS